ncbi:MAG: hypothetical protein WA672_00850, partial [Candidatus Angelobacter sp.]
EFRNPPQEQGEPAVAAPQSDQPQSNQNQPPANNNEPQLKTRPAQQPPDSQQQNSKPPQE